MIHLSLPWLAPTTNHVYRPIIKQGRAMLIMTTEGKKFKLESSAYLSVNYPAELAAMKPNTPYNVFIRFTVTNLINKGWAKGEAGRYKRHDVSNRFKVLEDVIASVTAVDDANYMMMAGQKVQGEIERTDIYIWNLEAEGSPFNDAALRIR